MRFKLIGLHSLVFQVDIIIFPHMRLDLVLGHMHIKKNSAMIHFKNNQYNQSIPRQMGTGHLGINTGSRSLWAAFRRKKI